jgi:alpha-D-xyloside xylohydrolase
VGGYLDHDDKNLLGPQIPFDTLVFARWVAVGGLSPFMQLHGRANITPWTVPDHVDETVAAYRYWAKLHHALVPFFYSLSEEAIGGSATLLVNPVGDEASWEGDFRFVLGDALLVAPLVDASSSRDVALPSGAHWVDFWHEDHAPYEGGTTVTGWTSADRIQIPLFVKEGAIVPLVVDDDVNGLGTAASKGLRTVLVYPGATASSFALHDGATVTTIDAQATDAETTVSLSDVATATLLRIRVESAPSSVGIGGAVQTPRATQAELDAATDGWLYDATKHAVWVKVPQGAAAVTVSVAP